MDISIDHKTHHKRYLQILFCANALEIKYLEIYFLYTKMLVAPKIHIDGFDSKGLDAKENLENLQEKVLNGESLSNGEITRLSTTVFRARINNQHCLNNWFVESVKVLISTPVQFKEESLLEEFNIHAQKLIRFVYYSAVFIIDTKERNQLFTLGVQAIRDNLVNNQKDRLISRIIQETRQLKMDQVIELTSIRQTLKVIKACGYAQLTIIRNRDGTLSVQNTSRTAPNNYFKSFEEPYKQELKSVLSKLPHKTPLGPLTKQIEHEHRILSYITSKKDHDSIMHSVEEETIKLVVSELEKTLPGMIHTRDEEVKEVVQLFKKVTNPVDTNVDFTSGTQFLKVVNQNQTLRPFKILAGMLRNFWINHQPKETNIQTLIQYKSQYDKYIDNIFENQEDIRLAFSQALEIIINKNPQLDIVENLLKNGDGYELIKYSHQPKLISNYGERLLQDLGALVNPFKQHDLIDRQINVIQNLISLFPKSSLEASRLEELNNLVKQFQACLETEQVEIEIPSFLQTSLDYVEKDELPESLQSLVDKPIVLNFGFGVVQFGEDKLVVSTAQLLILNLAPLSRQDLMERFGETKTTLLLEAVRQLVEAGVLLEGENLVLNEDWRAVKKTTVLI